MNANILLRLEVRQIREILQLQMTQEVGEWVTKLISNTIGTGERWMSKCIL